MRKNTIFMLYKKDMENIKCRRATTFCIAEWIVWRCEEYVRKVRRQKRREKMLKKRKRNEMFRVAQHDIATHPPTPSAREGEKNQKEQHGQHRNRTRTT